MPVAGARIDATRLHDGTYRGSAEHLDRAEVTITVADRRVTEVRLDELKATAHGQPAREVIPKRIVDLQSTKVDAVSGATEASNVIMNAAEAAVQRAYVGSGAPSARER